MDSGDRDLHAMLALIASKTSIIAKRQARTLSMTLFDRVGYGCGIYTTLVIRRIFIFSQPQKDLGSRKGKQSIEVIAQCEAERCHDGVARFIENRRGA